MTEEKVMVTGGAGFFGSVLVKKLLDKGHSVVSFDLNQINFQHPRLTSIQGDIRNLSDVSSACDGIDVVHHNVAQVPIAKDKDLFDSVNLGGARILSEACLSKGVKTLVYTSSSAVFGIPKKNPVTIDTIPCPAEAYGKAKFDAEVIFSQLVDKGINVSIVRPRTILGTGRLGIFQILFEWIYQGKNIPVLGDGDNIYQFVHAEDLGDACIVAGCSSGLNIYNIGASEFDSMRVTLETLVKHAGSNSRVVGVNKSIAKVGMNFTSAIGLSPLGPYHSLMYGESMYFDISAAKESLGFQPKYSNTRLFNESYDWYVENRSKILSGDISGSGHQSKLKQGVLSLIPYGLVW
jgi:nucleoside-diphosphate-sugar epimerase